MWFNNYILNVCLFNMFESLAAVQLLEETCTYLSIDFNFYVLPCYDYITAFFFTELKLITGIQITSIVAVLEHAST